MSVTTAPEPAPPLSVCIEGWNSRDQASRDRFEATLASLLAQTYSLDRCEILIAVDAADAQLQHWLLARLPGARLVMLRPLGYYRAKNALLREARGELIVMMDSDVTYHPMWLRTMLDAFSPGIDLVVGETRYLRGWFSLPLEICDWAATRPESGFTDWFYGNNLALQRALAPSLVFPEDIGTGGGGGVDAMRDALFAGGVRPWFCRGAVAYHAREPLLRQRLRIGVFHARHRIVSPTSRGSWWIRVPLAGPFLVTGGTFLKACVRAWWRRGPGIAGIVAFPFLVLQIAMIKLVEAAGAALYCWTPGFVERRSAWFQLPAAPCAATPTASSDEG